MLLECDTLPAIHTECLQCIAFILVTREQSAKNPGVSGMQISLAAEQTAAAQPKLPVGLSTTWPSAKTAGLVSLQKMVNCMLG